MVPGSAILIGGNPGAGKSTLLLQTLCKLAEQMKTLYVTGEESLQQVAMRAHRLGLPTANLNMLSETSIEQICLIAEEEQPKLMVIDSIQVMHMADIQSSPQRRLCPRNGSLPDALRQNARRGDRDGRPRHQRRVAGGAESAGTLYRLLSIARRRRRFSFPHAAQPQNRFGAVNELGVFAMTEQGCAK